MIQPVLATNSLSFNGLNLQRMKPDKKRFVQPQKEKVTKVFDQDKLSQSKQKCIQLSNKIKVLFKKYVVGDNLQVRTPEELEEEAKAERKAEIIFFLILLASQIALMIGPWVILYIKIKSFLK